MERARALLTSRWRVEQDWITRETTRRYVLEDADGTFTHGWVGEPPLGRASWPTLPEFVRLVDLACRQIYDHRKAVATCISVPATQFEPVTYQRTVRWFDRGIEVATEFGLTVAPDGARLEIDGSTEYLGPSNDVFAGIIGAAKRIWLRAAAIENAEQVRVAARGAHRFASTPSPIWLREVWTPPGGPALRLTMHAPEHRPDPARDAQWHCALDLRGVGGDVIPLCSGVVALDAVLRAAHEFQFVLDRLPPSTRFRTVHAADALDGLVLTGPLEPGSRSLRLGPLRLGGGLVTCDVSWHGYEVRLAERTPLLCLVAAARVLRPLSLL